MKAKKKRAISTVRNTPKRKRTTMQRVGKTASRGISKARVEIEKEKELVGVAIGAGILGVIDGKIKPEKLPKILQQVGLPVTVAAAAYLLRKFNVGGQQARKLLYAVAVAGFSIAAYNGGRNMALKSATPTKETKPTMKGLLDDVGNDYYSPEEVPGVIQGIIDDED